MTRIAVVLTLVIFYTTGSLQGQNLVRNGDFEISGRIFPFSLRTLGGLSVWSSPGIGSTDFYKRDSRKVEAPSGKRYVGMGFFCPIYEEQYRQEYLCGKLKQRLVKGKEYCLSFYIRRSKGKGYQYRPDSIDLYFSKRRLRATAREYIKLDSFESVAIRNGQVNDLEWLKVSMIYKAKGDEQFISIGKFTRRYSFERIDDRPSPYCAGAYYYIDKVELVETEINAPCSNDLDILTQVVTGAEPVESFVLSDIAFDFGKSTLSDTVIPNLDTFIATNLKKMVKFKVIGHTDSVGSDSSNLSLSLERARTVKQYMVSRGVKSKRIEIVGRGSSSPISSNSTNEGRAQNRRVEIRLIKR